MSTTVVAVATAIVALLSFILSPKATTMEAFYHGHGAAGRQPGVWTLALSQVTTWIFARSIMNAAILGYFYGIAGALAYAVYYLSFLTGAWIIDSLRFRHGFSSIQDFLRARFGAAGTWCYNFVIGLRLLSEVFANLLVIGLIFGASGSTGYLTSILLIGAITAAYSMLSGMHASIRTDVLQMLIFLAILAALLLVVASTGSFDISAIAASSPATDNPGWILAAVAMLQVWSYPMHDPVMMDRGFIAGRRTTRLSFYHAAWLSFLCILAFGLIGVWAGLIKQPGEGLMQALERLMGIWPLALFNIALVVSCMSTLDSTFASAAKLSVIDGGLGQASVRSGRIAMACFLAGGLLMVAAGSKDLFAAVAVSGTASMYLVPVVFISLWLGRDDVPVWSYLVSFAAAIGASVLYFLYSNPLYAKLLGPLFGYDHKYSKLLILSAGVFAIGMSAFAIGIAAESRQRKLAGA
jgi:SSS family solute:Na+ symporter